MAKVPRGITPPAKGQKARKGGISPQKKPARPAPSPHSTQPSAAAVAPKAKAKASPLDYTLLAELNTRPRTSYGAHLRNPNPALGDDA